MQNIKKEKDKSYRKIREAIKANNIPNKKKLAEYIKETIHGC